MGSWAATYLRASRQLTPTQGAPGARLREVRGQNLEAVLCERAPLSASLAARAVGWSDGTRTVYVEESACTRRNTNYRSSRLHSHQHDDNTHYEQAASRTKGACLHARAPSTINSALSYELLWASISEGPGTRARRGVGVDEKRIRRAHYCTY